MAELREVQGDTLICTSLRSDPLLFKDSPFAVKGVSLAMHGPGSPSVKAHVQAKHMKRHHKACNTAACPHLVASMTTHMQPS